MRNRHESQAGKKRQAMDERLLKSFVTTAQLGSVTAAAERLNLTQPALSRQIQKLEQEFGLTLFQRSGRNLRLSVQGDRLLAEAQAVLAASKRLHDAVAETREGECGLLRVGACSQVIERHMTDLLPAWKQGNPNIDIRLEEGGGAELARRLDGNELHLAINARHFARPDRFSRVDIGAMRVRAFCIPSVFGFEPSTVTLAQLCRQPLLLLNRRHFTRELFDAACQSESCLAQPTLESGSPHTLLAIARSSGGVAIVPHLGAGHSEGLVAHDILHRGKPLDFEMSAIWSSAMPLPGYGQRFIAHLRERLLSAV